MRACVLYLALVDETNITFNLSRSCVATRRQFLSQERFCRLTIPKYNNSVNQTDI